MYGSLYYNGGRHVTRAGERGVVDDRSTLHCDSLKRKLQRDCIIKARVGEPSGERRGTRCECQVLRLSVCLLAFGKSSRVLNVPYKLGLNTSLFSTHSNVRSLFAPFCIYNLFHKKLVFLNSQHKVQINFFTLTYKFCNRFPFFSKMYWQFLCKDLGVTYLTYLNKFV